jgi:hypothetical protein
LAASVTAYVDRRDFVLRTIAEILDDEPGLFGDKGQGRRRDLGSVPDRAVAVIGVRFAALNPASVALKLNPASRWLPAMLTSVRVACIEATPSIVIEIRMIRLIIRAMPDC